jgi:hypothetical protein
MDVRAGIKNEQKIRDMQRDMKRTEDDLESVLEEKKMLDQ